MEETGGQGADFILETIPFTKPMTLVPGSIRLWLYKGDSFSWLILVSREGTEGARIIADHF